MVNASPLGLGQIGCNNPNSTYPEEVKSLILVSCLPNNKIEICNRNSHVQWAAVITHSIEIREPPQKWLFPSGRRRDTCITRKPMILNDLSFPQQNNSPAMGRHLMEHSLRQRYGCTELLFQHRQAWCKHIIFSCNCMLATYLRRQPRKRISEVASSFFWRYSLQ